MNIAKTSHLSDLTLERNVFISFLILFILFRHTYIYFFLNCLSTLVEEAVKETRYLP